MSDSPVVWIVDDDTEMRESLVWLLESAGHSVKSFSTPNDLIEAYDPKNAGCLVLDLQLPGLNGIELYEKLREDGCHHPFIVISGHGDVASAMRSMHEGAMDFFEKPFDRKLLLQRVEEAIADSIKRVDVQARIDQLTRRERQVMELVAEGMLTKQIAKRLGISDKTVEVHRSHVTRKMKVRSVVQLVKLLTEHTIEQARPSIARPNLRNNLNASSDDRSLKGAPASDRAPSDSPLRDPPSGGSVTGNPSSDDGKS